MITHDSPEVGLGREIARVALVRTAIRFNITRDMEEASQTLGLALFKSMLRNHPYFLPHIMVKYGVEAAERGRLYCEMAGFPMGPLKIPKNAQNDQRRTPPEIRALWAIAREAVEETLQGLSDTSLKALTLNLSWGLHQACYNMMPQYRDEVDELRRIRRRERYSAGLTAILPLASLMELATMLP